MASPHVVIKVGEQTGLVYLEIDGVETPLDPSMACEVGEALFRAGADSRAAYEAQTGE